MKNWFNFPTQNVAELQQELLTLRATVNTLVVEVNTLTAEVERLQGEIKRRVLMSDIASLGQDVREHGVQLEELIEQIKVLTEGSVNTLAEDAMLAQVANGASVNTSKPSTRRKTPVRKGA